MYILWMNTPKVSASDIRDEEHKVCSWEQNPGCSHPALKTLCLEAFGKRSAGGFPAHGYAPNWKHISRCGLARAEYYWPLFPLKDA